MEESPRPWYFSTMPAPVIKFDRTKYGPELLVDVAWVHDMPTFILDAPHALDFYDIMLVTRGRGSFRLDAHRYVVRPGAVFFTSPGQVRDWRVTQLDGVCLFFTALFVNEFLRDAMFLHRLPYFEIADGAGAVTLGSMKARQLRTQLDAMRRELTHFRRDSVHLLRARLYEALIMLAREYAAAHGVTPERPTHRAVSRYRELVERDAPRRHRVADYARELAVSPGHLNALCKRYVGSGAKQILEDALAARARRMLLYTDDSAARIGNALGFEDPSYFARFFRRATGATPTEFRAR
jgi:AraC family transcriptional activator of pobA